MTALAQEALDWTRVLYIAEKEVAATPLWRALERSGDTGRVPAALADRMRRHAMVSDFRMLHLARRTQETVRELSRRGVPVMLLKGAAVGALVDPSFRERPMIDLDVLVRRSDLERARAAIVDAGWPENRDPKLEELLRDQHHLPPFIDPQLKDVRLELHFALLPPDNPFRLSEDDLWSAAIAAPEPFSGAVLPSAEHQLLHASTHFAWAHSMRFGAWRTIRLINSLLAARPVDWERFITVARETGAAHSCYWTLRLAARLGSAAVPASVLDRLRLPGPEWIHEALERHFISQIASGEGPSSPSMRVSRLLWQLALRPGWGSRAYAGRWDTDHRWEHARGEFSDERVPGRIMRHAKGIRRWWDFAAHTLRPRA